MKKRRGNLNFKLFKQRIHGTKIYTQSMKWEFFSPVLVFLDSTIATFSLVVVGTRTHTVSSHRAV